MDKRLSVIIADSSENFRRALGERINAEKDMFLAAEAEDGLEAVYEFYMRGLSFAPIDLYESDATKFLLVGDKQLRAPFVSISGLGETAARDLAACTKKGLTFVSVEDVSAACSKVSQTHIETLKNLGALGDMPETSQMSLF